MHAIVIRMSTKISKTAALAAAGVKVFGPDKQGFTLVVSDPVVKTAQDGSTYVDEKSTTSNVLDRAIEVALDRDAKGISFEIVIVHRPDISWLDAKGTQHVYTYAASAAETAESLRAMGASVRTIEISEPRRATTSGEADLF